MNQHQLLAIQALENFKGDNLYRAESAFRQFTPKQMQEQHGESGKTRQQILEEYTAHENRVSAAIQWIKHL